MSNQTIFGRLDSQWDAMEALATSTTRAGSGQSAANASVSVKIHRAWFTIFVRTYNLLAYFYRFCLRCRTHGSGYHCGFFRYVDTHQRKHLIRGSASFAQGGYLGCSV